MGIVLHPFNRLKCLYILNFNSITGKNSGLVEIYCGGILSILFLPQNCEEICDR
jgi:hypothetical protein